VEVVGDGLIALKTAREIKPDLIVLDVMLPNLDGFEVCKILSQEMNIPILMLTAKDEEIDRVIGLEMGADDYITKPFSMREFLARVKAHLRRVRLIRQELDREETLRNEIIQLPNLTLNLIRREVVLNDRPLSLKPKEFDLLLYFAQHQGHVLSREKILEEVWDWDFTGGSRTVDVHIRWLREKIEEDPAKPARLVTVRGIGYRFEG